MRAFLFAVLFLAVTGTPVAKTPDIHIAKYYGDKDAAVSYTFDDGLEEHFSLLREQLNRHGFVATFGIIGSKVGHDHKGTPTMTWQQIYQLHTEGHEISNHGWEHRNLTVLSPEERCREIHTNDSVIQGRIGILPRTFIYPGNRHDDVSIAACETGKAGSRIKTKNLGGRYSEQELRQWIDDLIVRKDYAITMTHGISYGYDHFKNPDILWRHFDYVDSLSQHIWVATMADLLSYIKERQATSLVINETNNGLITVTPTVGLDRGIYNHPLTLVYVSDKPIKAEQDGAPLKVKTQGYDRLIDFNPHGGDIIIRECSSPPT